VLLLALTVVVVAVVTVVAMVAVAVLVAAFVARMTAFIAILIFAVHISRNGEVASELVQKLHNEGYQLFSSAN